MLVVFNTFHGPRYAVLNDLAEVIYQGDSLAAAEQADFFAPGSASQIDGADLLDTLQQIDNSLAQQAVQVVKSYDNPLYPKEA